MAVNVLVPMTLDEVQELRRTLSVLEAPHRVGPEMEAECRELARKWHRELDTRWVEPATHTVDALAISDAHSAGFEAAVLAFADPMPSGETITAEEGKAWGVYLAARTPQDDVRPTDTKEPR